MKIYFSGSISGGRDKIESYIETGKILNALGHDILTEHILDPKLGSCGEKSSPRKVFLRDKEMLKESDVIIAEITTPSHGVGYELALGVEWGKPVLCLVDKNRKNKKISAMIEGNISDRFIVKEYTEENLKEIIEEFLAGLKNFL